MVTESQFRNLVLQVGQNTQRSFDNERRSQNNKARQVNIRSHVTTNTNAIATNSANLEKLGLDMTTRSEEILRNAAGIRQNNGFINEVNKRLSGQAERLGVSITEIPKGAGIFDQLKAGLLGGGIGAVAVAGVVAFLLLRR